MYEIETENAFNNFSENKEMFDFSNYSAKSKYYDHSKKFLYAIIYVPDQHKIQQMCEKAISKNPEMLQFIPYCNKILKMCKKSIDYYLHALEYVSDCYMTEKMRQKVVNTLVIRNGKIVWKVVWIEYYLRLNLSSRRY